MLATETALEPTGNGWVNEFLGIYGGDTKGAKCIKIYRFQSHRCNLGKSAFTNDRHSDTLNSQATKQETLALSRQLAPLFIPNWVC